MGLLGFLLAFAVSCQTAGGSIWPFESSRKTPARIHWSDGRTSDVLLTGFSFEQPPPGARTAPPAGPALREDLGRGNPKLLTPRFETSPDGSTLLAPPLLIDSIAFSKVEERVYGSNNSARWFSLGKAHERIPPPPDWYSSWDESSVWRPARRAPVDPTWTYLPGAAWLWTTSDLQPAEGEKVLFRQRFALPRNRVILRAVLWVEADRSLDECYLNGKPLPWPSQVLGGKTVRAYVERLVKPGENLIAFSAVAPQTGEIDAAEAAWHLKVLLAPLPPPSKKMNESPVSFARAPFSVRTLDGGWIPATRVALGAGTVELTRPTGDSLELDRAAVRWIEHWPLSATSVAPVAGSGADSPSPAINGAYDDFPETEGIWTLSGAFHRGRVTDWSPAPDRFSVPAGSERKDQGSAGEKGSYAIRAVLTSPAAGDVRWDEPAATLARQVRLLLRDGTHLTGLLEPSSGDRLILNLPGQTKGEFPISEALRVDFPALPSLRARSAFQQLERGGKEGEIGFLGEVPCRGGPGCVDSVIPPVERVAQAMGVGTHWLKPQEILLPEYFTPQRFPVLINVDTSESYYHTIQRPGDGHQALLQYMNQGGILIHLAPGTPFFYGRQAHSRQWAMVPLGGGLNRAFGLTISSPGAGVSGTLFEVPDNSSEPLEFQRVARGGWAVGLPAEALFPCIVDSRFRPVSPTPQRAGASLIPLYRLIRGKTDYGLAAAAVRLPSSASGRPPAYTVYIAWPLAQTRDEFGNSLLPRILPAVLEAIARDRAAVTRK